MSKFSKEDVINYADGHMDVSDAKLFEEALSEDAELQTDLTLYKSVKFTLKSELAPDNVDNEFKDTLQQLNKQYFKKKKPVAKLISLSKIWYAAAVLVIGFLVWAPWNKNLYNKYGDTEMISFAERGSNDHTAQQDASDAYNGGNYKEAKELLQDIVAKDPANDMFRYYLGVSQLKTSEAGGLTVARENLIIVASKGSLLKYDAMFFIALSYLKDKNKEEARVWLSKIPSTANTYEKAQKLLKDL